MKALTIHQPWASAIAGGIKRFETRGWKTDYRGPLVIHAGKVMPRYAMGFARTEVALGRIPRRLPLGAVVCVVELVDVRPTVDVALEISAIDRLYGDYTTGRWAWQLEDVRVLAAPLSARGKQGLWNWPIAIEQLTFGAA